MADTIPPQDWYILQNRIFLRIHLGRTYNDEDRYYKRFKIAIEGEKYRKKVILSNEKLSDKWKSRATKLIDNDLKNLKNLNAEGDTGTSIIDRIWTEAHLYPESLTANTLKYGYRNAQKIELSKALYFLGELKVPKAEPTTRTGRRWNISQKYYRRGKQYIHKESPH